MAVKMDKLFFGQAMTSRNIFAPLFARRRGFCTRVTPTGYGRFRKSFQLKKRRLCNVCAVPGDGAEETQQKDSEIAAREGNIR